MLTFFTRFTTDSRLTSWNCPDIIVNDNTCNIKKIDYNCTLLEAISILENENVLNQFKNQAKEHAMKFEKQFIIPQYEQLYNEVVQSYKKA